LSAFEAFHDQADGLWITLQNVVAREPEVRGDKAEAVELEPFVACEEDRPVPIEMRYKEPLKLLDPDAALLGFDES
jgi:hypothetical protein